MTWNGTETCDQGYSKTTIANDTRESGETAILQVCLFEFLSTRTTTILESTYVGTVGWIASAYASQATDHALKVAQLSEKRASSNNRETNTKTPNNATKDGNNFVTEELLYI